MAREKLNKYKIVKTFVVTVYATCDAVNEEEANERANKLDLYEYDDALEVDYKLTDFQGFDVDVEDTNVELIQEGSIDFSDKESLEKVKNAMKQYEAFEISLDELIKIFEEEKDNLAADTAELFEDDINYYKELEEEK